MERKLLAIDTETSGLDPDVHSVLSIGAAVWSGGAVVDSTEIFVRSLNLEIQPEALAVNRIDLAWLQENGITSEAAVAKLEAFVHRNFDTSDPKARATLIGHNVSFDLSFLKRLYKRVGVTFDNTFSHRTIDTASIVRFLILAGMLPLSGAGSTEAFEYFGIKVSNRHSALADAIATTQLFDKLIELVQRQ
jgi:DNA polymerase III epsilon subunit-like protein